METTAAALQAHGALRGASLRARGRESQERVRVAEQAALAAHTAQLEAVQSQVLAWVAQARVQAQEHAQSDNLKLDLTLAEAQRTGAQALATHRQQALQEVEHVAQTPHALAETQTERVTQTLSGEAQAAQRCGEAVAVRHDGQGAQAARALAARTAQDLHSQIDPLVEHTHTLASQQVEHNLSAHAALGTQLGAVPTALGESLTELGVHARASLDSAHQTALERLDRLEADALAQLDAQGSQDARTLRQHADAACEGVHTQAEAEAQAAEAQGEAQAAALRSGAGVLATAGDPERAERAVAGFEQAAFAEQEQTGEAAADALEITTVKQTSGLEHQDLCVGLTRAGPALRVRLDEVLGGLAQAGADTLSVAQAGAGEAQVATLAQAEALVEPIRAAMEQDNRSFEAELHAGLESALAEAQTTTAGLAGRCEQAAREAERPGWQDAAAGVWAAFEGLVEGFVVFVVLVAALVGFAVLCGVALTAALVATCAAAAGLFLLLYSAVQSVGSRLDAGQSFGEALEFVLFDTVGLTTAWEATTGVDTRTGARLDPRARWQRGAETLLALVEVLLAARSARRSPAGERAPAGAERTDGAGPRSADPQAGQRAAEHTEAPGSEVREGEVRGAQPAQARLPDAVQAEFEAVFGASCTQALLDRFGAAALEHYGPEFFRTFRGVTPATLEHLLVPGRISKGQIRGAHDEAAFREVLVAQGNGAVVSETTLGPGILRLEYKLFKRGIDGKVTPPPELQAGAPYPKTVVRGLAAHAAAWQQKLGAAVEAAVRGCQMEAGARKFTVVVDGNLWLGYIDRGVVTTLFPKPPEV